MKKIKLALDAGHGQNTYPETGSKGVPEMPEHDFNATVVKYAKELAELNGFEVVLTQPLFGKDVPLRQRTNKANKENVDLLISFHADANSNPDANGHWIFYWHTSSKGKKFAQIWDKYANKIMGNNCRGIQESKRGSWTNFHMVRETKMPAVLIEHEFMTSPVGIKLLLSDDFRRKCAETAIRATCEYFGVPFKEKENKTIKNNTVNIPQVTKERIYAQNGTLKYVPLDSGKPYSVSATDVRFIKFNPEQIKKVRFVYAKGKTVSQIAREYGCDYAFNFPFFYNGQILGDAQDNDKVISAAHGKMLKWHEFAYADGKFIIGQLDKNDKQEFLVQGAPLLIENGRLVYEFYRKHEEVQDDIGLARAQRTFVGVDADGGLILAVADGRTKSDKGLTLEEMALYMKDKGAVYALNGDGGGSSTLVQNGEVLNANKKNERIVHHAILIWLNKEPSTSTPSKGGDKMHEAIVKFDDDGKITELDALLKDGKTYVEVRKLAELYGSKVVWDQATKTVNIKK